jgi:hypothetical protein
MNEALFFELSRGQRLKELEELENAQLEKLRELHNEIIVLRAYCRKLTGQVLATYGIAPSAPKKGSSHMTTTQFKQTTQYRCELTLPDGTAASFRSDNLNTLQDHIQQLLGGNVTADEIADKIFALYHRSVHSGSEPLGWINPEVVPDAMSVRKTADTRLKKVA